MNTYRVILSAGSEDVDFETVQAGNAKSALRKFLIQTKRVDEDDGDPTWFDLLDDLVKYGDWLWYCAAEEGEYYIVKC